MPTSRIIILLNALVRHCNNTSYEYMKASEAGLKLTCTGKYRYLSVSVSGFMQNNSIIRIRRYKNKKSTEGVVYTQKFDNVTTPAVPSSHSECMQLYPHTNSTPLPRVLTSDVQQFPPSRQL